MPSLQSRIFRFLLQNRHLLRFQLKRRDVIDFNTSIPRFREDCEKSARLLGKIPPGIEITPVTINGIPAEWIMPSHATKDRIILYAHGGGYVAGSCNDHRALVARVVKGSGIGALLYEYRLAPEHPYPAALEDSLTVYRWLLDQGISPAKIMIAGESAGGGLCLAILLALRDQGMPLPAAAVAITPWTDLKCTGEYYGLREPSFRQWLSHVSGKIEPRIRGLSHNILFTLFVVPSSSASLLVVEVVESVDKLF